MANLATNEEVELLAFGKSSGNDVFGSDVTSAIEDAQEEIFEQYGDSVKIEFQIFSDRRVYEFRKDRRATKEIKFVFVDSPNVNPNSALNRNEVPSGSYTADLSANKLTFTASQIGGWNSSFIQVDYIPNSWHLLTKAKAALNLIDGPASQINPGSGPVESTRVTRLAKKVRRLEAEISPVTAQGSEENKLWDPRDRQVISQKRFNKTP